MTTRFRILPPDHEDTEVFLSVHKSLRMTNRDSEIAAIKPKGSSFVATPSDVILSFRQDVPDSCKAGKVIFAPDLIPDLVSRHTFERKFPHLSNYLYSHEEDAPLVSKKKVGWPIYFAKTRERFSVDLDYAQRLGNFKTKRLPDGKNWSKSWREDLENSLYCLSPDGPEDSIALTQSLSAFCCVLGVSRLNIEGVYVTPPGKPRAYKIRSISVPSYSSKESYFKENISVLYSVEKKMNGKEDPPMFTVRKEEF